MNTREQDLTYALMWLRNHYDIGRRELKAEVIARIDKVLEDGPPITRRHGRRVQDEIPRSRD